MKILITICILFLATFAQAQMTLDANFWTVFTSYDPNELTFSQGGTVLDYTTSYGVVYLNGYGDSAAAVTDFSGLAALDVNSPVSVFYYHASSTFDLANLNGVLTLTPSEISVQPVSVPEPSTNVFFCLAVASLWITQTQSRWLLLPPATLITGLPSPLASALE